MRKLMIFLLFILLVTSAACSNTSVIEVEPYDRTFAIDENREYILVNPIEINSIPLLSNTDNIEISIYYPEITGLKDINVENKINKIFKDRAEAFLKPHDFDKESHGKIYRNMSFFVTANYNNVLSIRIDTYMNKPDSWQSSMDTVLLDLNTGDQLALADLFLDDSIYATVVYDYILSEIMRQDLVEDTLYRPLTSIEENQSFYISDNELIIFYQYDNPYFRYGNPMFFYIPFHRLSEPVVIYDKYLDANIFVESPSQKKMLPNKISYTQKRDERVDHGYYMEVGYLQLENLPNKSLQEMLNKIMYDTYIDFINDEAFIQEALAAYRENDQAHSNRFVNFWVTANYSKILSIQMEAYVSLAGTNTPKYNRKTYLYHIETGTPIVLKDLFKDDVDYIRIINEEINLRFREWGYERRLLEPFSTINEDAKFYLDQDGVVIYFDQGEILRESESPPIVYIPFSAFDGGTIFD